MRVESISNDFNKIDDFKVWSCHNDDLEPNTISLSFDGDFYNLSVLIETPIAERLVKELTQAIAINKDNTE